MKSVRVGILALCALLPALAGCGSGSPPPFTLACTSHRVARRFIQVNVTVTNATKTTGGAILYGPVFIDLRHFAPVNLVPRRVTVEDSSTSSYPGFLVPHVAPQHPAHAQLRFLAAGAGKAIAVTASPTVRARSDNPLQKTGCVVGGRG